MLGFSNQSMVSRWSWYRVKYSSQTKDPDWIIAVALHLRMFFEGEVPLTSSAERLWIYNIIDPL